MSTGTLEVDHAASGAVRPASTVVVPSETAMPTSPCSATMRSSTAWTSLEGAAADGFEEEAGADEAAGAADEAAGAADVLSFP